MFGSDAMSGSLFILLRQSEMTLVERSRVCMRLVDIDFHERWKKMRTMIRSDLLDFRCELHSL